MFESTRVIKDAEAYFEDVQPQMEGGMNEQVIPGGEGAPGAGVPGQGNGAEQGMVPSAQAVPGVQNQPLVG